MYPASLPHLGMAIVRSQGATITTDTTLIASDMRDLMPAVLTIQNRTLTMPSVASFIDAFGFTRVTFVNSGAFKLTFAAFAGDSFFGGVQPALLAALPHSITFQPAADRVTWMTVSAA